MKAPKARLQQALDGYAKAPVKALKADALFGSYHQKPWEVNRPGTDLDGSFLEENFKQNMNDAFNVASDAIKPPYLKMKGQKQTKPFPEKPIEVETVEQKNLLIHLYHLLVTPPPLVWAGASVYGHFLRALHDENYLMPFSEEGKQRFRAHVRNMLPQLETMCPFVVNHNWKAVLEKAGEGDTGEFQLPHPDATVFEFAMEGMRVLATATEMADLEDVGLHLWVRLEKQWVCLGAERLRMQHHPEAETDPFYAEIRAQIRAACIVMEAEVAERDTIRADYKRNEKRVRHGQHPFFDYHVVRLANRHRLARSDAGPANDEKRASPRLHFVRGHYRHFDNWKTWIKWHYRGDADLGFIDKEYRL